MGGENRRRVFRSRRHLLRDKLAVFLGVSPIPGRYCADAPALTRQQRHQVGLSITSPGVYKCLFCARRGLRCHTSLGHAERRLGGRSSPRSSGTQRDARAKAVPGARSGAAGGGETRLPGLVSRGSPHCGSRLVKAAEVWWRQGPTAPYGAGSSCTSWLGLLAGLGSGCRSFPRGMPVRAGRAGSRPAGSLRAGMPGRSARRCL
jgi:hypothetical protein